MRSVAPAIRLFEPITLLFPEGAMPALDATIPSPNCLLCEGPASPPSRMGWLETPERQAVFVCCGACSDCSDQVLEAKIVAKVSDSRPEISAASVSIAEGHPTAATAPSVEGVTKVGIGSPPMVEAHPVPATWVKTAAKAWARPAA